MKMNGRLVQILIIALVVALPVLLIVSSQRKADTQRRIAVALEEIAKRDRIEVYSVLRTALPGGQRP